MSLRKWSCIATIFLLTKICLGTNNVSYITRKKRGWYFDITWSFSFELIKLKSRFLNRLSSCWDDLSTFEWVFFRLNFYLVTKWCLNEERSWAILTFKTQVQPIQTWIIIILVRSSPLSDVLSEHSTEWFSMSKDHCKVMVMHKAN